MKTLEVRFNYQTLTFHKFKCFMDMLEQLYSQYIQTKRISEAPSFCDRVEVIGMDRHVFTLAINHNVEIIDFFTDLTANPGIVEAACGIEGSGEEAENMSKLTVLHVASCTKVDGDTTIMRII